MLYILSFIGILIENSLPFSANTYIITLPFFVYLVSLKQKREIITLLLIVLFLALQTDNFFFILLVLTGSYFILLNIFNHLIYGKGNIFVLALLQGGIYIILSLKNLHLNYIIINMLGFIVMNYVYIFISRKKDSIKG